MPFTQFAIRTRLMAAALMAGDAAGLFRRRGRVFRMDQLFLLQDDGTVSGALTVLRVGREEYARQGNGLDQIVHRRSNAARNFTRCPGEPP